MEAEKLLNATDNTQQNSNPQDAANPGASNGADFQSTAPATLLNEKEDNLTVQKTGDPVVGDQTQAAADSFPLGWAIGIVIAVVVGAIVLVMLLREAMEEADIPVAPLPVSKPKVSKKPAAKKKSNPNQRRKKTPNKKRK